MVTLGRHPPTCQNSRDGRFVNLSTASFATGVKMSACDIAKPSTARRRQFRKPRPWNLARVGSALDFSTRPGKVQVELGSHH